MTLVCAIIGVPISYNPHTYDSIKLLNLIPLFQLVIILLILLVKSCSIISTCDNYINCNCEFQLASINCGINIQWIKRNEMKRNLFRLN